MKVKQIAIRNIMGINELNIEPGDITHISGANGSGKTSTAEALISAIDGGSVATLVREGAESGEIVVLIDNGMSITKTIKASGTSKTKLEQDEVELQAPATAIKRLFGPGFNPVKFLSLKGKDQLDELLRVTPIVLDDAHIAKIVGSPKLIGVDYSEPSMKLLSSIYTAMYNKRKLANSRYEDAYNNIKVLKEGLIVVDSTVTQEEYDRLGKERDTIQGKRNDLNREYNEALSKINEDYQEQLQQLQKRISEAKEKASESLHNDEADLINEGWEIEGKMKEIKVKLDSVKAQESTKARIKDEEGKRETFRNDSTFCDEALRQLVIYKKSLIKPDTFSFDVTLDNDTIHIDGIPFDRVNRAKQIKFAIEVAEKSLGDIRFILVDGAEALDSESLEQLEKLAIEKDIQLMLFSVSDKPGLTITSE